MVRGGTTTVSEVLPTESYGYSVRLSASKSDRVLFIESTATFDETTGDLIDFISTVKSDDIAAGNAAESVEGSDPMAMPSWLDVRAPLSTGTSDFTGDRLNDILARDKDGVLWVYRGQDVVNSNVTLGNRVRVGGGWNTMSTFVAAGDMNSDGRADVLARDTSGRAVALPRHRSPVARPGHAGAGQRRLGRLRHRDRRRLRRRPLRRHPGPGHRWLPVAVPGHRHRRPGPRPSAPASSSARAGTA